jgi:hypothetical protein
VAQQNAAGAGYAVGVQDWCVASLLAN